MKTAPTPAAVLKLIKTASSKEWGIIREKRMLALFKDAAKRVPAYKDFLKKNRITPDSVRTFKDFEKVPPTSKADYLRKYPMKDLLWDGNMQKPLVFSATSGSTGKPFYFPRGDNLSSQYSVLIDMFMNQSRTKGPTLVIVCLGMGVWIGGLITFQALERANANGRNLSILTPGLNKDEIFHALADLAPNYKETVMVGYPPFIKDILDEASLRGLVLKKLNLRLLFAAESFTEVFRDHVAKLASIKNTVLDTLNIYGTADIGAMAFETPTAIATRRLAFKEKELYRKLFGSLQKVPTFAQYNPLYTSFEAPQGNILLTGDSALPLIRYAVGDSGGVLTYDQVEHAAREAGTSVPNAVRENGASMSRLPFVFVYERADFSVKLSGAIIYPEPVREALQSAEFAKYLTGKFTMQVLKNKHHDSFLEINVEMRPGVKESVRFKEEIAASVVRHLLAKNSEYKAIYSSSKDRAVPKIVLWTHGDPLYFKPYVKQKWVIKDTAPLKN